MISNVISANVAVIFVFSYSTRYTFQNVGGKSSLKLVMYIFYQVFSIFLFSIIMQFISSILAHFPAIYNIRQVLAKIIVTPLTLLTNFIVMKYLIEKFNLKKFGG